jgi:hypothetical protein
MLGLSFFWELGGKPGIGPWEESPNAEQKGGGDRGGERATVTSFFRTSCRPDPPRRAFNQEL